MDFLETHITAREFLRRRIYEEVLRHNSTDAVAYNGLVTPTDLEQNLNRTAPKAPRRIDWEAQYQKALENAATRQGMTKADLEELSIPTLGLETVGAADFAFGDVKAELRVQNSDVLLTWFGADDKTLKTRPRA